MALKVPPITGRALRVLSLDGGGMKGLATVQMLRHIERMTGAWAGVGVACQWLQRLTMGWDWGGWGEP